MGAARRRISAVRRNDCIHNRRVNCHHGIGVAPIMMMATLTLDLTRFNKIATQGAPQMAVDKEANSLSRVYSYYSKFNLCLFYV